MSTSLSKPTLGDLRCCEPSDRWPWIELLMKYPTDVNVVDVFCSDALPSWCAEQRAERKCIRPKGWKPLKGER